MFKARWLLVVVLANAAFDSEAKVLTNEYTIDDKGNYKLSFMTSNGMTKEEIGSIANEGEPNEHVSVIGRYTYLKPEGQEEEVQYTAGGDEYNILPPGVGHQAFITAAKLPPKVVATLLGK